MKDIIPVFIGYDAKEAVAFHVCAQSIIAKASRPVAIYPLALNTVADWYIEAHTDGSNAFIYSRFLIPWVLGFGTFGKHAIFIDGDMTVRDDIAELWDLRRHDTGVQVVKHDYKTKHPVKYTGAKNEDYPRKNWSSVVIWNANFFPNRCLTPEYVASKGGDHLHRFAWLEDEQIGELPSVWNHLTLEYDERPEAKLLHHTVGIPAFPEYAVQEGADEWRAHYAAMLTPMGATHGD